MLLSSSGSGKNVYRIGGASFGLAGVFWLLNLIVLFTQGQPPVEGQAFLDYVVKQRLALQGAFLIFFVIDVLLVLGVTALYLALKHSGTYFLFGSVLGVVAITIDLGNTVVTYAVLGLSSSYSVATNEAQRFAYGAAAEFARVIILDVGAPFFNILFSISILAMSASEIPVPWHSRGHSGNRLWVTVFDSCTHSLGDLVPSCWLQTLQVATKLIDALPPKVSKFWPNVPESSDAGNCAPRLIWDVRQESNMNRDLSGASLCRARLLDARSPRF